MKNSISITDAVTITAEATSTRITTTKIANIDIDNTNRNNYDYGVGIFNDVVYVANEDNYSNVDDENNGDDIDAEESYRYCVRCW